MTKAAAAIWLRRLEIVLAAAGIFLLGGAIAATAYRWLYQAHEERALVRSLPPVKPPLPRAPQREPQPAPASDPLVIGAFEIPRLGLRAIVREGTDAQTLAIAVGHVGGTARPGQKGNTVLAGHRDTFFRELRNIRKNDTLKIIVPPNEYEYRVVSTRVVAPTETKVLNPTSDEELTLVTCYPFHYIGHAPRRFIVRAKRID